jgi:hypothetical protein
MTGPNIATLGLALNTTGLQTGRATALQNFAQIKAAAGGTMSSMTSLQSAIAGVGAAFAALKLSGAAQELLSLAARYETLGVVLKTVGNNAGYADGYMKNLQRSLQETGISMVASRQVITQFIQSQLSLAQASKLARTAQDAAVIANQNSSDTLLQIVHAIQSGQSRILMNIGLNLTWAKSYEDLAKQLNTTTEQLSNEEKVQARVNAVLDAGKTIAGAYASSMTTAGKQVLSMQRYVENLKVQLGELFLPVYTAAVFAWANALKAANNQLDVLQAILVGGAVIAGVAALAVAIKGLMVAFTFLNPVVALLTLALATFVAAYVAYHAQIKQAARDAREAIEGVSNAMYGEESTALSLTEALKKLDFAQPKTRLKSDMISGFDAGGNPTGAVAPGSEEMDEQARKKEIANIESSRIGLAQQLAVAQGRVTDAEKLAFAAHMTDYTAQIEANKNLFFYEKDRLIALEKMKYFLEQHTEQLTKNLNLQREIARLGNTGNTVPGMQGGTGFGSGGVVAGPGGPTISGAGLSYKPGKAQMVNIPGLGNVVIPAGPGSYVDATGQSVPVTPNGPRRGLPDLIATAPRSDVYSYGDGTAALNAANGPNYNAVTGTGSGIMQGSKSSGLAEEAGAQRVAKERALAEAFTAVWLSAVANIEEGIGNTFGQILNGQIKTLKDFATALMTTIRNIFAQIASAYATSLIAKLVGGPLLNAAQSAGGVPIQKGNLTQSMAVPTPTHHSGGIAGGFGNVTYVDPSIFLGAYRYHTGGIAGLRPGEVPAILERGERIIPRGGSSSAPPIIVHQTVQQNLQAIDGANAAEFLMRNGHVIAHVVAMAAQDVPGYAAILQGRR